MSDRTYPDTHPWLRFEVDVSRVPPALWSMLGEAAARCDQIARAVIPPAEAAGLLHVFLAKGVRATTAIEGNTLSEDQVRARIEGTLDLPPSQEYLGREVDNVVEAINGAFRAIADGSLATLSPEWLADANRGILAGLEAYLEEGVVPGEIPPHDVVVGRYRAPARRDCAELLARLCDWLEDDHAWSALSRHVRNPVGGGIVRAVLAHLYFAWVHPFGDGNGRTARLLEFTILVRAGIPAPCAHLLSNHYNATRAEYYLQLDRSSRAHSGRGDVHAFLAYALGGFVEGLRDQCRRIEAAQLSLAWEHYVHERFRAHRRSAALHRRREVTLALGRETAPVRKRDVPDLSTELARQYATKTAKTLTRDMNWLVEQELLARAEDGYVARTEAMRAFRPGPGTTA